MVPWLLAAVASVVLLQSAVIWQLHRIVKQLTQASAKHGLAIGRGEEWIESQVRLNGLLVNGHNHLYREMIGLVTSLPMRSTLPPV